MQEPPLNEEKTVLGNVEEGVGRDQGQARPLQRDLGRDGRAGRRLRRADGPRWASCRRPSTPPTPGTSTPSSSRPWTRCAARRRTPTSRSSPVVSAAASRCASCCWRSPTCCCSTSPPTTSTPRACCGSSSTSRSTPAPSSPSPTTGTSSTTSPSGSSRSTAAALYPYEGNYSTYLEKKAERLEVQGKKDAKLAKRLKDELEWVRSNAKGRQTKSKARLARYEEMAAEADRTRKLDFEEIQIPPGPRLGSMVIEAKNLQQGLRRPRAHRRPLASRCRATASSASSARTASARPRCSRRSSASRSSTPATLKVGETVKISYVDQSRGGIDPKKNAVGDRVRRARLHQGRQRRDPVARLRRRSSASRARTSRRRPACCPVVSATGSTSR